MTGHHVGLGKLQVSLAGPSDLPGNQLVDGPGLGKILPVPVEYRNLAKRSVVLVFRPLSKTDPEVVLLSVTSSQQKPYNLALGFQVKENKFDHSNDGSVGFVID